MQLKHAGCAALVAASLFMTRVAVASPEEDRRMVAGLDTEFQAAVKVHDVATIDRIQHPDMVLVLGDGQRRHQGGPPAGGAREEDPLRDPGRGARHPDRARVRRHGRRHGAAPAQGNERGRAIRPAGLVQRHLRAHARGLEVFLRPGVAEAAGRGADSPSVRVADAAATPCGARRTRSCRARRAAPRRRRRSGAGSRTT